MSHRIIGRRVGFGIALLGLIWGGCGGRSAGWEYEQPDASAASPDSGSEHCTGERYLRLEPHHLHSLYLLDPPSLSVGQTLRVAAGLELGGCTSFAHVTVQTDEDARVATVVGWVWEEVGDGAVCTEDVYFQEEILTLSSPRPGDWRVVEGLIGEPGGGLSTDFLLVACPASDCECFNSGPGDSPTGAWCNFDCQCDGELLCLSRPAGVGGRECARSCSDEAQCEGWETCLLVDGDLYGHCAEPTSDECSGGSCPAGFVCTQDGDSANFCEPVFDRSATGDPCVCHADCPPGLVCADLGDGSARGCYSPCRGASDCPGGVPCAAGSLDHAPICFAER
jgi:hypothetical protein